LIAVSASSRGRSVVVTMILPPELVPLYLEISIENSNHGQYPRPAGCQFPFCLMKIPV
jgi:hypothetical protein